MCIGIGVQLFFDIAVAVSLLSTVIHTTYERIRLARETSKYNANFLLTYDSPAHVFSCSPGMAFYRRNCCFFGATLYRHITVRLPERTRLLSNATGSGDCFTTTELKTLQAEVRKLRSRLHLPSTDAPPPPKRAIAITVGWANAPLKVVNKFSRLYTDFGIPCLCVAPSITHIWSSRLGSSLTGNLFKALDTTLTDPCHLILHLFSSGSTAMLPKLSEEHASSSPLIRTKFPPACVVFDSGPADFSYESGTAAAKHMYDQGGFNLVSYWMANSVGVVTEKLVGKRKRDELCRALDSPLLDIPQLFLYSEADTVSRFSYVEDVIARQRSKGRNVTNFCWKDSLHVRHFITHPTDYTEQVTAFLKKCSLMA